MNQHSAEVKIVGWREVRRGRFSNERVPIYEWQGAKSGVGRTDLSDLRYPDEFSELPWPVHVVGTDDYAPYVYLVRKDVGLGLPSRFWALWWPVRGWLNTIRMRFMKTLHVWNFATTEIGTIPTWRSLHLCEPFRSWWKAAAVRVRKPLKSKQAV